jgi:tRNA(Ile2) C34 agmatinyltransferase TiaS
MKFYVAFDDTDTLDCGRGTGKLARWFADVIPAECKQLMVVRQQLLHSPEVPMTSHNSSLCCVVEAHDTSYREKLIELGIAHIKKHFVEGSDPGFCVATENDDLEEIVKFGLKCTHTKTTQVEAMKLANKVHLSGHGGTNDGIIGAIAAVGLTHLGESGRIVDYADLRELPQFVKVSELRARNIFPMSVNRHAEFIPDNHSIDNQGSLRPHLWAQRLVVPVIAINNDIWQTISLKKDYGLGAED